MDYLEMFRKAGRPIFYDALDGKSKYLLDDFMLGLPFGVGDLYNSLYFRLPDLESAINNNPNVSWDDAAKYHRTNLGFGSVARAGYNFVSSNIRQLYSDENAKVKRKYYW